MKTRTLTLAQSRHLCAEHNQLPRRFAASRRDHSMVETGFGNGLHFLACAECWLQNADASLCLDYLAVEPRPLSPEALKRALDQWPELAPVASELLKHYRDPTPGYRRYSLFGGRVRLTLVVDTVDRALPDLAQSGHGQVDSWLLGESAPDQHPDSRSDTLYRHMARLSRPGARFATVSGSPAVQRGLEVHDFELEHCSDMGDHWAPLCGYYDGPAEAEYPFKSKPWFVHPGTTGRNAGDRDHWLVVGGGLAGCLSARALADRGYRVTLIERRDTIATMGSGNRAGVIFPGFSPHDSAQYRYYQYSFLTALQRIGQLLGPADNKRWNDCGVLIMATDDKVQQQQSELVNAGLWPTSLFRPLDDKAASEEAGTSLKAGGLLFPGAGWLHPAALCQAALEHPAIDCLCHTRARTLTAIDGDRWRVDGEHGESAWSRSVDGVILANAGDARELLAPLGLELPLKAIRGQISQPEQSAHSQQLSTVVCHQGYITPALDKRHEVGATFNLKDDCPDLREQDHQHNLDTLGNWLPELRDSFKAPNDTLSGRVGFRWQTPDYLPMVGPLPRVEAYREQYRPLALGMKHAALSLPDCYPGLYLNIAHGSRGITSACLAAEIIASGIDGGLFPVDQRTLDAVHPARFLIRAIKRGHVESA